MRGRGDRSQSEPNSIEASKIRKPRTFPVGLHAIVFVAAAAFSLVLPACEEIQYPLPGSPCMVNEDQIGTFQHRIELDKEETAHVRIDDRFTKKQQSKILKAIEEWNEFSRASLQRELLSAEIATLEPNVGPQNGGCSVFIGGSETSFDMIRADSAKWKELGAGINAMGVVARCLAPNNRLHRQAVFINADRMSDSIYTAIALHELGHALGLKHSCVSDATDMVGVMECKSLHKSHPYRKAIMYPEHVHEDPFASKLPSSDDLQFRNSLRENDIERAYCHYASETGMAPEINSALSDLEEALTKFGLRPPPLVVPKLQLVY